MTITYAGVPIEMPSNADELATRYWHGNRIEQFEHQGYFTSALAHLPTPYPPKREAPRVGVLSWPVGADRWATCHLLATGAQLSAVRAAVGSVPAAKPLVFNDGAGGVITADMFLLPGDPVSQRGDGREYYLLTLVDERWWWHQAGNVTGASNFSWTNLLTSLFTAVGATATISVPDGYYLSPNANRWDVTGQMPILLEAACRQIGMRLVRKLNGQILVTNYSDAKTADDARWTAIREHVYSGGRITGQDVGRAAPESVDVKFFDGTTTNVTLASLGLTDYGGVNGAVGRKGFYAADPSFAFPSEKANLAQSAAGDYYKWFLAPTSCTLRAFKNVDPTGLDDTIEWVHHQNGLVTRILRPQWSDRNVYGSDPPNDECPLTGGETSNWSGIVGVDNTWIDLQDSVSGNYVEFTIPRAGTYWASCAVPFFGFFSGTHTTCYVAARLRCVETFRIYDTTTTVTVPIPAGLDSVFDIRHFTALIGGPAGARFRLQGYRTAGLGSNQVSIGHVPYGPIGAQSVAFTAEFELLCPSSVPGPGSGSGCVPFVGWNGAGPYCVFNIATGRCHAVILTDADRCNPNVIYCSGPYGSFALAEAACPDAGGSGSGGSNFWYCCDEATPVPTAGTVAIPANGCGLATSYSLSVYASGDGTVTGSFYAATPEDPLNGSGGFVQCSPAVEGGWWSQMALSDGAGGSLPPVTGEVIGTVCGGESGAQITVNYTFPAPCSTTMTVVWTLIP